MKLPFVSRELYDRAVREADEWRMEHHRLQECYYHVIGPQITPRIVEPSQIVQPILREPTLIAQTIKEEADGDPKLARWLRKRASELRRDGKSDGDIVSELQKWETTEPEMGVLG